MPLSGTSYAAPVVSGLAALIRARFPALTARQVMQRIESTAHHPPAGWDPLVGNGIIDALAAVSTARSPHRRPTRPQHRQKCRRDRRAANAHAYGPRRPGHRLGRRCDLSAVLVVALARGAGRGRLRRPGRDSVAGD